MRQLQNATGARRLLTSMVMGIALAQGANAGEPVRGFHDRFETVDATRWHVADYRFSHPAFDTDWSPKNLHVSQGLTLSLTPQTGAENRFLGASIRRSTQTHYGRYEALLRPAKGDGLVTGFFTYTGPHYGTQHDEIDIEFLGKDTTRVQLSWFVDGQLHSRSIALGFDAADAARRYAFEWHPAHIHWFVEDHLLLEITAQDAPLPQTPGYLFSNIWAADASVQNWAGHAPSGITAQSTVGYLRFVPL